MGGVERSKVKAQAQARHKVQGTRHKEGTRDKDKEEGCKRCRVLVAGCRLQGARLNLKFISIEVLTYFFVLPKFHAHVGNNEFNNKTEMNQLL